jgi:putative flavoprotein involved in K+ transport
MRNTERVHTVIIGAGQAGLAAAYHLKQRGVPFVILEANERVGDSWRKRWDSLRLFTPARFSSGMPFPRRPLFPTKDRMADYLEAYADRFVPVRSACLSDQLTAQRLFR